MKSRACGVLAILALAGSAHAAEIGRPIDLRIVVDVSQHVSDGDLRGRIIEMLVRTLPPESRGGLWTYGRYVNLRVKHEPVTELWKQIATVHGRNLSALGDEADIGKGLRAATWDVSAPSREERHVVLITSGVYQVSGAEAGQPPQARINEWIGKLALSDIAVHVVSIGAEPLPDYLRQIADVGGGLRTNAADAASAEKAALDLVDLLSTRNQALVDPVGRFQVEPGTRELTALWMSAGAEAALVQPDGSTIDSATPFANGRWLVARDFEMATVQDPQVGWWQVNGTAPDRVGLFADLGLRVAGLAGSVVPTQESSAVISITSRGEPVADTEFLALLDVRAWVNSSGERKPLPIEQKAHAYEAYFVNLEDGPQELEVAVTGPTFMRKAVVPFVVYNPLSVEVRQAADGSHIAWVQFAHAAVDYSSLKVTGKFRHPPEPAHLVPGQKSPAGMWKIPMEWRDGIVESSFSISGNYLNKEGFFLKTRAVNMALPLTGDGAVFHFDAEGNVLDSARSVEDAPAESAAEVPLGSRESQSTPPPAILVAPPSVEDGPLIPLWFAGVIGLLNLLIGAAIWWLLKPQPLPELPDLTPA